MDPGCLAKIMHTVASVDAGVVQDQDRVDIGVWVHARKKFMLQKVFELAAIKRVGRGCKGSKSIDRDGCQQAESKGVLVDHKPSSRGPSRRPSIASEEIPVAKGAFICSD